MNIRDLQYLVAVVDLQHVGKAALRCHVSQPTLSMQLKKLEETLGAPLFERRNKQLSVTPLGEQMAVHARNILQEVVAMKTLGLIAQDPLAGSLRLGAFPTLAPYFLPAVVPKLAAAFPKLTVLLVEEKTATLLSQLKEGVLDAALIALPVEDESLLSLPLCEDPFMLAVPPGHTLAARSDVKPHDLENEPLLLLDDGHCLRHQALDVCHLLGASERQDFRATSLETLRQMVAAGVGITLMPAMAMRAGDGLVYVPFAPDAAPSRTIGLVWRKSSVRQALMQALASEMMA